MLHSAQLLTLFFACHLLIDADTAPYHPMSLHVHSAASTKCQIPSLLNATSEELLSGLKQKCFTSIDLVNVSYTCNPLMTDSL